MLTYPQCSKCPVRRCLGTQNLLQNHLRKGLEHKGIVICPDPLFPGTPRRNGFQTVGLSMVGNYWAIGARWGMVHVDAVGVCCRDISGQILLGGRNPVNSPVEVGCASHYLQVFCLHPRWVFGDFWTINSSDFKLCSGKSRLVKYYIPFRHHWGQMVCLSLPGVLITARMVC